MLSGSLTCPEEEGLREAEVIFDFSPPPHLLVQMWVPIEFHWKSIEQREGLKIWLGFSKPIEVIPGLTRFVFHVVNERAFEGPLSRVTQKMGECLQNRQIRRAFEI